MYIDRLDVQTWIDSRKVEKLLYFTGLDMVCISRRGEKFHDYICIVSSFSLITDH